MDANVLLEEKIRTNIDVQEETSYTTGIFNTLMGKFSEAPGEISPLYKRLLENFLPLVRALVVVTLFLVNGIGFSPIGCKTQYLFTSKFWYNKQLVIFFIIYFIINLGGYTIVKLSDPRKQFILSIAGLLLFNILARMGEVWYDTKPFFWPGPLTYFGLALFPLVLIYVIDDMRRYMMANYALNTSRNTITTLKKIEIALMIIVSIIMLVGFIKAYFISKKSTGKNFNFILFLFGAPIALKNSKKLVNTTCSDILYKQFDKETKYSTAESTGIRALLGYFGLIIILITSGFFIVNKKDITEYLKSKIDPLKEQNKNLNKKSENRIN